MVTCADGLTESSSLLKNDSTESDLIQVTKMYHPAPPVLKIGDQLLVLNEGELIPGQGLSTPQPVITVVGAEGLQKGEEDDEIPSESTQILSVIRPKLELDSVTPQQTVDFAEIDPSTALMTEAIVNKIKSLTNVESTTNVAKLLEQIYIKDVEDKNGESSKATRFEVLGENKEQNPAYPPIPDVMNPEDVEDTVELPQNETNVLNRNLTLPEYVLKQIADSDNITDDPANEETTEIPKKEDLTVLNVDETKSKETVEDDQSGEDSGETITSRIPSIQAFVVENASVESSNENSQELLESVEELEKIHKSKNNESSSLEADVELIDPKAIVEELASKENVSSTAENLIGKPIENTTIPTKRYRRSVSAKQTDEDVFKLLNEELVSVKPRIELTDENSDAIFKELLDDATAEPIAKSEDKGETDKRKDVVQKLRDIH